MAEYGKAKLAICFGLSAATGGLMAVMADIMLKDEASAVGNLTSALGPVLEVQHVHEWAVALLLVGMGVALSFIFGADSAKNAFYVGASILAIMVTMVPNRSEANLPTSPLAATTSHVQTWWEDFLIPSTVLAQGTGQSNQSFPVSVQLDTSDKQPVRFAVFTLIDQSDGQIQRSRVQSDHLTFYVRSRPYTLRVQVDGYAIAERTINPPQTPAQLSIQMTPSGIPLTIQRLIR